MALQNFPGAILIVSHDRHLLKSTVDEYWLVDEGKVSAFDGDLDDYHQYLQKKDSAPAAENTTADPEKKTVDRKEQKRLEAERRQKLAPLKKQLTAAEKAMEKLQKELSEIEEAMSDTSLYDEAKKDELNALIKRQGELKSDLEAQEMVWMELTEEMESFED